jgi:hypothetical protein
MDFGGVLVTSAVTESHRGCAAEGVGCAIPLKAAVIFGWLPRR